MDRGRKAMPVQNKACYERHVQKCQERHKQKLIDMKSSIDNKEPRMASHLKSKAKKNALMEERFKQIETENKLLLQKMSHIMRNKGSIDNENNSTQYGRSLNRDRRKRELQRITKQNQQILHRLTNSKPIYDHVKWEEEAKAKDEILANICEFKTNRNQKAKIRRKQKYYIDNNQYSDDEFYEDDDHYNDDFD